MPLDVESELEGLKAGRRRTCARVLATEHVILPRVLGWLAEGRLAWREGKGWLDGKPLEAPIVEDFPSVAGA